MRSLHTVGTQVVQGQARQWAHTGCGVKQGSVHTHRLQGEARQCAHRGSEQNSVHPGCRVRQGNGTVRGRLLPSWLVRLLHCLVLLRQVS
jgi:hypothetical protein